MLLALLTMTTLLAFRCPGVEPSLLGEGTVPGGPGAGGTEGPGGFGASEAVGGSPMTGGSLAVGGFVNVGGAPATTSGTGAEMGTTSVGVGAGMGTSTASVGGMNGSGGVGLVQQFGGLGGTPN